MSHSPEASFCFSFLPLTVFSAYSWFLILQYVGSHIMLVCFLLSSLLQPQHKVTYQSSKPSVHVHYHEYSLFVHILKRQSHKICLLIGLLWVRSVIASSREILRCFRSYRHGRLNVKEKSSIPGKMWVHCTLSVQTCSFFLACWKKHGYAESDVDPDLSSDTYFHGNLDECIWASVFSHIK